MPKIEIQNLSKIYSVRKLDAADTDMILSFCLENTLFYQYCGREPSREQIENDMRITPPGISTDQKYYIGFFDGYKLAAVMDLIDGYPKPEIAYIGFFMMNNSLQGRGIGSSIIAKALAYLKTQGFVSCRLGIDKDNPQARHFWKKNGFEVIREVVQEEGTILVAEKDL